MSSINPLVGSPPRKEDCVYIGAFLPADPNARFQADSPFFRYKARLTVNTLWLHEELSIPVSAIRAVELIERGFLPPRKALAIAFENPVTRGIEVVYLCKMDPIGFGLYFRAPLEALAVAIEGVRAFAPSPADATSQSPPEDGPPQCESCRGVPAYYVAYTFLIGAALFFYRAGFRRRVHCARHILIHGLPAYFATALLGWPGISILAYPFVLWHGATTLKPAIGGLCYVLFALPIAALGLLAWLLLR